MMYFEATGGWGEERADLRMGILASLTANINRGKDAKAFQPSDFMPRFGVDAMDEEPRRGGRRVRSDDGEGAEVPVTLAGAAAPVVPDGVERSEPVAEIDRGEVADQIAVTLDAMMARASKRARVASSSS